METDKTIQEIVVVGIIAIFFICWTISVAAFMVKAIDGTTEKKIGEESVQCLDKLGRPFEDEMCTQNLYCSSMGLKHGVKCKDVNVGEVNDGRG